MKTKVITELVFPLDDGSVEELQSKLGVDKENLKVNLNKYKSITLCKVKNENLKQTQP